MQYQNSHDAASSLQQYISEAVSKNSTHNKRPNVGQGRLEQTDLVGQGRRPISICQKLGHRLWVAETVSAAPIWQLDLDSLHLRSFFVSDLGKTNPILTAWKSDSGQRGKLRCLSSGAAGLCFDSDVGSALTLMWALRKSIWARRCLVLSLSLRMVTRCLSLPPGCRTSPMSCGWWQNKQPSLWQPLFFAVNQQGRQLSGCAVEGALSHWLAPLCWDCASGSVKAPWQSKSSVARTCTKKSRGGDCGGDCDSASSMARHLGDCGGVASIQYLLQTLYFRRTSCSLEYFSASIAAPSHLLSKASALINDGGLSFCLSFCLSFSVASALAMLRSIGFILQWWCPKIKNTASWETHTTQTVLKNKTHNAYTTQCTHHTMHTPHKLLGRKSKIDYKHAIYGNQHPMLYADNFYLLLFYRCRHCLARLFTKGNKKTDCLPKAKNVT